MKRQVSSDLSNGAVHLVPVGRCGLELPDLGPDRALRLRVLHTRGKGCHHLQHTRIVQVQRIGLNTETAVGLHKPPVEP